MWSNVNFRFTLSFIHNGKYWGGLNCLSSNIVWKGINSTVKILTSGQPCTPVYSLKRTLLFLLWVCVQWVFFSPLLCGTSLNQAIVFFPAGSDLSDKFRCKFQILPPLQALAQHDVLGKGGAAPEKWVILWPLTSPLRTSVSSSTN